MFISRVYRPDGAVWPWYTFLALELPLTVALLALFGIADPDTYRTKLWQDGADNGFNSSPTAGLYAAANYQPYKTPAVWSQWYEPPAEEQRRIGRLTPASGLQVTTSSSQCCRLSSYSQRFVNPLLGLLRSMCLIATNRW